MPKDEELFQRILDDEGMEEDEFLERYALDSVVPGACTNCGFVVLRCEPDAHANYCEDCGQQTVKSALALLGWC